MNQEIEGKLREILGKHISWVNFGEKPHLDTNEAIKAIQELVCSTVPDERLPVEESPTTTSGVASNLMTFGFNEARTEILKKRGKL